jgi:hypothetical protein
VKNTVRIVLNPTNRLEVKYRRSPVTAAACSCASCPLLKAAVTCGAKPDNNRYTTTETAAIAAIEQRR